MRRVLINTYKNVRRSPYQALAAMLVLTLTMFVAQIFSILSFGAEKVLQYFETRPQVTAFFTDEVTEQGILELKNQLEAQSYVSHVEYVSKQDALAIYREQNSDDPLLLEMVTADILPASLEVSAVTVADMPMIKDQLEAVSGIEEVIFHEDVIQALQRWTRAMRIAGISVVAFLGFTSLLVISIIISIKASSKRHEISIMRLLGATQWFIHGPFVFEGAIYGLVSAVLSWGLAYVLLLYATPALVAFFGEIQLLPIDPLFMLSLLGGSVGLAVLVGMLSGNFASKRFGV